MDLTTLHAVFMERALEQARIAFEAGEVPIGAVLVNPEGVVVAEDYNRVEEKNTQAAHAELLVLAHAGTVVGDWRLEGCWLYVTLEPCAMCFNALLLSRVAGVVFGASSPLFGYHLDNVGTVSLYRDRSLPIEIVGGVNSGESVVLLQRFFREKRGSSVWSKRGAKGSSSDQEKTV